MREILLFSEFHMLVFSIFLIYCFHTKNLLFYTKFALHKKQNSHK